MDTNYIRERITELRMKKDVSEHRMSLDLGHARSYIHSIVSGRVLPSMSEFLFICEYFEITPKNFFDEELKEAAQFTHLEKNIRKLSEQDLTLIVNLTERLLKTDGNKK